MLKESHRKSSEGGVANEQKTTGTQNTNNYQPPQYNLASKFAKEKKKKGKTKQKHVYLLSVKLTHFYSGDAGNILCTHLWNFIEQFVVFLSLLKSAQIAAHSNKQHKSKASNFPSTERQMHWQGITLQTWLLFFISHSSPETQTHHWELEAPARAVCSSMLFFPFPNYLTLTYTHTEFRLSSWQHSPCLCISAHDYTDSHSWILIASHWLFMTERVSGEGCHSCCWWQMNIH